MERKSFWNYFLGIALVVLTAVVGNVFTSMGRDWYQNLNLPTQWVPDFVFPIMWSVIYTLIALAIVYLIYNDEVTSTLFWLFALNACLNVLWCLAFFALQSTIWGQVIIICNLTLGIFLVLEIASIFPVAKVLWIYPLWLMVATSLNTAIWILN